MTADMICTSGVSTPLQGTNGNNRGRTDIRKVVLFYERADKAGRKEKRTMNVRNEIKAVIAAEGLSMQETVELLSKKHGGSRSISNFSGKLLRGTIRYSEVRELADALGYEIRWIKKK